MKKILYCYLFLSTLLNSFGLQANPSKSESQNEDPFIKYTDNVVEKLGFRKNFVIGYSPEKFPEIYLEHHFGLNTLFISEGVFSFCQSEDEFAYLLMRALSSNSYLHGNTSREQEEHVIDEFLKQSSYNPTAMLRYQKRLMDFIDSIKNRKEKSYKTKITGHTYTSEAATIAAEYIKYRITQVAWKERDLSDQLDHFKPFFPNRDLFFQMFLAKEYYDFPVYFFYTSLPEAKDLPKAVATALSITIVGYYTPTIVTWGLGALQHIGSMLVSAKDGGAETLGQATTRFQQKTQVITKAIAPLLEKVIVGGFSISVILGTLYGVGYAMSNLYSYFFIPPDTDSLVRSLKILDIIEGFLSKEGPLPEDRIEETFSTLKDIKIDPYWTKRRVSSAYERLFQDLSNYNKPTFRWSVQLFENSSLG